MDGQKIDRIGGNQVKACPTHEVKFSEKSPNKAGKFWHVIDYAQGEYCSITKEEYDAVEDAPAPQNTTNNSFTICNAMNNTVALIVGGKVELKDLEPTYKRILSILESPVQNTGD